MLVTDDYSIYLNLTGWESLAPSIMKGFESIVYIAKESHLWTQIVEFPNGTLRVNLQWYFVIFYKICFSSKKIWSQGWAWKAAQEAQEHWVIHGLVVRDIIKRKVRKQFITFPGVDWWAPVSAERRLITRLLRALAQKEKTLWQRPFSLEEHRRKSAIKPSKYRWSQEKGVNLPWDNKLDLGII